MLNQKASALFNHNCRSDKKMTRIVIKKISLKINGTQKLYAIKNVIGKNDSNLFAAKLHYFRRDLLQGTNVHSGNRPKNSESHLK